MFGSIRKLRNYLAPCRLALFNSVLLTLVFSLIELVKPWPLKIIIDNILGEKPVKTFFTTANSGLVSGSTLFIAACAAILLLQTASSVIRFVHDYYTTKVSNGIVNRIRADLHSHILRLSLSFHSRNSSGDLVYRVINDAGAVQRLIRDGFLPVIFALAFLIGMSVVMMGMAPDLTLIAASISPILFWTVKRMGGEMKKRSTEAREIESSLYSGVGRIFSSIRTVQAFSREGYEDKRFLEQSRKSLDANLGLNAYIGVYCGVFYMLMATGTVAVVWFGGRHVMRGELTVGDFWVFMFYLDSLYQQVYLVSERLSLFKTADASLERIFEVLDSKSDMEDRPGAVNVKRVKGAISMRGVSFSHSEDEPVLEEISFDCAPGQMIALVGHTGSGKSTLANILSRSLEYRDGVIAIDGKDIRSYTVESIRRQISIVPQEPVIFPATVYENIAYGIESAAESDVLEAAGTANAHEFISKLPEGYDTVIGESSGITLSGGERQRIAIARAVIRKTPILILDEPTSALDARTEFEVMKGIESACKGKTVFVIAHRLSTVRKADLILVLDNGRIVECGRYWELVNLNGHFSALHHLQFDARLALAA